MVNASTVVTVTSVSLLTGMLGYAVYFDYKRRNDPQFRSRLRKDAKRTQREQKRQSQLRQKEAESFIERTVAEFGRPGALPEDSAAREQTFSQQVQIGEVLAAQGAEHYLPAAAAFYKALKMYPNPNELLMIYRQAVPQEALNYIFQMVAMDPTMDQAGGGADPFAALTQAAALARQGGSRLEEVDDEAPQEVASAGVTGGAARVGSTANSSATSSQEGGAQSVSSQEWEKVSTTNGEEHEDAGEENKATTAAYAGLGSSSNDIHNVGQAASDAATGSASETAPAAPPVSQAQP